MIPKKIYQTYRENIPEFAVSHIKNMNHDYEYEFFNDNDCIKFIENNFDKNVYECYNEIKRPQHKADLFRYCLLYINGGVYIDIDIQMMSPIDEIINKTNNSDLITVKSENEGTGLYQGFIITKPKNEIFKILINDMLINPNPEDYGYHIKFFGQKLLDLSNLKNFTLYDKVNISDLNISYYLFNEIQYIQGKWGAVDSENKLILCGNYHNYPFENYYKCCK